MKYRIIKRKKYFYPQRRIFIFWIRLRYCYSNNNEKIQCFTKEAARNLMRINRNYQEMNRSERKRIRKIGKYKS